MNPGVFRTTVSFNVYENDDPEELGTQVSPERYVEISTGLLIDKEKNGKSWGNSWPSGFVRMAMKGCSDSAIIWPTCSFQNHSRRTESLAGQKY